jgi:hypothetical protein
MTLFCGSLCVKAAIDLYRFGRGASGSIYFARLASRHAPKRSIAGQRCVPRRHDALTIARQAGLLRGPKTEVVWGRMPEALVRKAKAISGARSDTELIETALANLAVADEYPNWLLSQKGTVGKDVDLEF